MSDASVLREVSLDQFDANARAAKIEETAAFIRDEYRRSDQAAQDFMDLLHAIAEKRRTEGLDERGYAMLLDVAREGARAIKGGRVQ